METNDSNIKPKQTGGLKLMTVFVVVLALHVVVIGGFTAYNLMKGGSPDADLVTSDKNHKGTTMADGTMPDAGQGDKSAAAPTAAPEVTTIPANPPESIPAPDTTAPAVSVAPTVATTPAPIPSPAPTPAPVLKTAPTPTLVTPAPAVPASATPEVTEQGYQTPTGPTSSELAPPAEPSPVTPAPAPVAPISAGPVHMPSVVTKPEPASHETYVVKITDSYKKIAHAHHITVAQLKEANHIRTDVLHAGQKLIIPSGRTSIAESTQASGDAPDASLAGTGALASSATLVSTSSTPVTTSSHSRLYTVMKGDTLTKIAHKFKTTMTAIMSENNITDPTRLTIGKKLKIPSKETRSAKNGTPTQTQPSQVDAKPDAPSGQLATFVP